MPFQLTATPIPGNVNWVTVPKAELLGACDLVIEKNEKEVEVLRAQADKYPLRDTEGNVVPPWGHKSEFITIALEPWECRKLKIEQSVISHSALQALYKTRYVYDLPKSLRDVFQIAQKIIAYPNQSLFKSRLALASQGERCDEAGWNELLEQFDAVCIIDERQKELPAVEKLKQGINENPEKNLVDWAPIAEAFASYVDGRIADRTGVNVGWKSEVWQSYGNYYGFETQRILRSELDVKGFSTGFEETFDKTAGKGQRRKLVAEFGETEVTKRLGDVVEMLRQAGINVPSPKPKPPGNII